MIKCYFNIYLVSDPNLLWPPVRLGGEARAQRVQSGGVVRALPSARRCARAPGGEEPVRELRDGHHRPLPAEGTANPKYIDRSVRYLLNI